MVVCRFGALFKCVYANVQTHFSSSVFNFIIGQFSGSHAIEKSPHFFNPQMVECLFFVKKITLIKINSTWAAIKIVCLKF